MQAESPIAADLEQRIFLADNDRDFESIALKVYQFQYQHNPLYRRFSDLLGVNPRLVREITGIPFLPVGFFKSHAIQTTVFMPQLEFRSSGTTGQSFSRHLVKDEGLYRKSFQTAFRRFFGPPSGWAIIALLPSYLERGNSSLVYMVDHLIRESGHPESGFYLQGLAGLRENLVRLTEGEKKIMLFGVSFSLLDFVQEYPVSLPGLTIVETGGMKGRREEITRQELHRILRKGFGTEHIFSEYGMTELLSQAYAADGLFQAAPSMKVLIRDETDPGELYMDGLRRGAINIVDLANLYSCSFLATDDLGILHPGGRFEVLGRMDNSDIRGCSLLTA